MAQQVKPPAAVPTDPSEHQFKTRLLHCRSSPLVLSLEKQQMAPVLGLCTAMGDLDKAPGSWLQTELTQLQPAE